MNDPNQDAKDAQIYGVDATEWLCRWDAGEPVWTIEMGRPGPGYEQVIQIAAAEILRHLLAAKYSVDLWKKYEIWQRDCDEIERAVPPLIEDLGISGAQWFAALSVAVHLYRDGPIKVMRDRKLLKRHILVSKKWPKIDGEQV